MNTTFHKINNPKIEKILLNDIVQLLKRIDINISKKDFKTRLNKFLEDNNFEHPGLHYFPSSKQIYSINDKLKTAICVQTGHFGMFYYDLFKLNYLFEHKFINQAIIICPTLYTSFYQNNVITIEKIIEESSDFKSQINLPILTIGVE